MSTRCLISVNEFAREETPKSILLTDNTLYEPQRQVDTVCEENILLLKSFLLHLDSIYPTVNLSLNLGTNISLRHTRSSNWKGKQHLTGLMPFQLDGNRLMSLDNTRDMDVWAEVGGFFLTICLFWFAAYKKFPFFSCHERISCVRS